MSSDDLSKAEQNFIRFVKACVDLIKLPLIDILTDQINPKDLYNKIGSCTDLVTGKHKLLQFQSSLCYLSPPDVPDYKSFDVTLLYKLIINLCSLKPPTKGWFKKPEAKDTSIGADIERLRLLKNSYSHDDSTEFPDIEFQNVWKDLKCVIQRFQKEKWRKYDYEDELEKLERIKFGYEDRDQCKLYLKAILNLWEQLNHKDEPEIMIKGENNVLFGDKARFDVEIKNTENNSNWLVTWQKKTGDVIKILRTSDEKYKESTNRRLCIWSVCKEDEAEYQAVIYTGEKSSIFSNSIHLHGLGDMPFFSVWDIKTDKKELTIIYEYGVTQSSPQVFEVKWAKNGKPLNWENNRYLGGSLNDKYLTITSPTSDGKGTYSCTVTNAVGSVSKDFPFDVPNATLSTENSEVVFRSETKVKSLVTSCPKPDGVEWQKSKDGINFLGIDINKPHYHGSSLNRESPLLLISNTVFKDMSYYRIRVWNKIGEHLSDPLYIDVKGSPPNITSSHETDVENRSVKLIGKVFLYDQSHEILDVFWSMGENKIDTLEGGNKYSKVSIEEPSLTIFNVNEHDAGSYQLTATNAVGQTKSHVIVLEVNWVSRP